MPRWSFPLVVALVAVAPSAARAAGPVCALLDPEKHPRAALLEAKLLADPAATWVERNAVEKVLAEQKLQALFGPQGVGDRVRLGRLLKADLLVSVRPVQAVKDDGTPDHVLEVAVSETAGGLRLLVRGVLVTDDADADVAALLAAVKAGVARFGEKIAEVVAVPPFVSQDLGFQGNYLKAAYARVAEGVALARPGVLVVELDEAEALAKEVALTAPGTPLVRPPAVYLLGEFRHEGVGKGRTVTLTLRAQRGGKPVGVPAKRTVRPDEAAGVIRAWVADVLRAAGPAGPADPRAEAKLLAARARELRRLGFRAEALDLLEAAILLDPVDPDPEFEALRTTRLLLKQRNWSVLSPPSPRAEAGLQLHRRGLEHLEAFVVKGGRPAGKTVQEMRASEARVVGELLNFIGYVGRQRTQPRPAPPKAPPEIQARHAEIRRRFDALRAEHSELLFRIIPHVLKWEPGEGGGSSYTGAPYLPAGMSAEAVFLDAAVYHLPVKERFAAVEKFIHQVKDLPDADRRIHGYLAVQWHNSARGPEIEDLLARLDASGHEKIRAAVQLTRKYIPQYHRYVAKQRAAAIPHPAARPTTNDPPPPDPGLVTFTSVPLEFSPPLADARPRVTALVAVGPGVDVLAAGSELYVMKEKGKARRVWAGPPDHHLSLTFDGRFVWVLVSGAGSPPQLVVFDPLNEQVRGVGGQQNLPEGDGTTRVRSLRVTALGPGRVCLAGSLAASESTSRAWVGVGTYDAAAGASVKVFHEAKVALDPGDTDSRAADVAFDPGVPVTYRRWPPGEKAELRVVLPRTIHPPGGNATEVTPLLVDPDRGTVEVLPSGGISRAWVPVDYPLGPDGSLYEVSRGSVWRVTPDGRREEAATGVLDPASNTSYRTVFLDGGRLQVIDRRTWRAKGPNGLLATRTQEEWWEFDPATDAVRFLTGRLPPWSAFAVSAHYGPVVIGRGGGKAGGLLRPNDPGNVYAFAVAPPGMVAERPEPPRELVKFTPVTPMFVPPEGGPPRRVPFATLAAAGPGVDVLAGDGRVFVMKEKGIARQVMHDAIGGATFGLTFDGRFVWVVVHRGEKGSVLFVLNPATGRVQPVTPAHGLPAYRPGDPAAKPVHPAMLVLPLGPGRVCVAASIQAAENGRWWLGVITFDPLTGPAATQITSGPAHPAGLERVVRWPPDGTGEVRIRFARHFTGGGRALDSWIDPLLLFDLDGKPTVRLPLRKFEEWVPADSLVSPDGMRYEFDADLRGFMMTPEGYNGRRFVLGSLSAGPLRRVLPDGTKSEVPGLPHYDRLYGSRRTLQHDGRLLVADGYSWTEKRTAGDPVGVSHWRFGLWEFDPATEEVRQLSANAPPIARLAVSSHYGVVAIPGGGPRGEFDRLGGRMPSMYVVERVNLVAEK